ncbi:UNVERIFIED_CONTAM: hypothetical protein GTU68_065752 [Idotea baltica]|nr:hypothetical protein [Idotea baltica]
MTFEYLVLIPFIFVCLLLSLLIFILSYFLGEQKYDSQKLSAYECGFQPFEDTKSKFNIKFYLVAILFIIFDLEVVFLFP